MGQCSKFVSAAVGPHMNYVHLAEDIPETDCTASFGDGQMTEEQPMITIVRQNDV